MANEAWVDIAHGRPLALVTGVDRALGAEMARGLLDLGHDVIATAPPGSGGHGGRSLAARAGEVALVEADLASRDGVNALHGHLTGWARPLAVVNVNVEIGPPSRVPGDPSHPLDLGVRGAIYLAQRCVDGALARDGALLVTTRCAPDDPSLAHLRSFLEATRVEAGSRPVASVALRFDPGPGAIDGGGAAHAPPSDDVAAMAQEALATLRQRATGRCR